MRLFSALRAFRNLRLFQLRAFAGPPQSDTNAGPFVIECDIEEVTFSHSVIDAAMPVTIYDVVLSMTISDALLPFTIAEA